LWRVLLVLCRLLLLVLSTVFTHQVAYST
jgi:hypothetical protein